MKREIEHKESLKRPKYVNGRGKKVKGDKR